MAWYSVYHGDTFNFYLKFTCLKISLLCAILMLYELQLELHVKKKLT